ncbi:MAG: VOC family protein [Pseudomonadota bacterium]
MRRSFRPSGETGLTLESAERTSMPRLDHIVFAARSLAEGTDWLTGQLGCPPAGGGSHPLMGTHNSLWRMGSAYIEMICIDPQATPPARNRWYSLDDPATQSRLVQGPLLLHWVVEVADLTAARAAGLTDPGPPLRVTRDDLYWDLTVPEDGGLQWSGAYPTLIAWPEGVDPPAARMPDQGITLNRLTVHGPEVLGEELNALGARDLVRFNNASQPGLQLEITTGDGGSALFR